MDLTRNSQAARTLISVSIAVLGYLINYFLNLFVAKHTAPHFYGDFSVAVRVLLIVTTLTMLGTDISTKRFLSKYVTDNDYKKAANFMHWNLKLVRVTFIICLVVALVSVAIVLIFDHMGIHPMDKYHMALYFLWVAPLAALALLLVSYMMCHQHFIVATAFANLARYGFLFAYLVVAVYLFDDTLDSMTLLWGFMAVMFVIIILQIAFMRWRVPRLFSSALWALSNLKNKSGDPSRQEWLKTSIRLIVNGAVYVLIGSMDLIILEIFHPAEADVGHYAALLTIVGITWVVPAASFDLLRTKISSLIDSPRELQACVTTSIGVAAAITLVLISIIAAMGKILLSHFGPSYVSVYDALLVVLAGGFIGVMGSASTILLAFSGCELKMLIVTLGEFVVFAVLGSVLAYYYGVMGMAIATLLAISLKVIAMVVLAKRMLSVKPLVLF